MPSLKMPSFRRQPCSLSRPRSQPTQSSAQSTQTSNHGPSQSNRRRLTRPFTRLLERRSQQPPVESASEFPQPSSPTPQPSRPSILRPKLNRAKSFLRSLNCFKQTSEEATPNVHSDHLDPEQRVQTHEHQHISSLAEIEIDDQLLGRGEFGSIYPARKRAPGSVPSVSNSRTDTETQYNMVVKQVPVANEHAVSCATREWDIVSSLRHPHIVSALGQFTSPCGSTHYLAMERMHGPNLLDIVLRHGVLREADAFRLMRQILEAVCFMHRHGVGHLDIKPENIMLKQRLPEESPLPTWWRPERPLLGDTHACVIDFGLAVKAQVHQMIEEKVFLGARGTPVYAAPEVSVSAYAIEKADVWSCGATLFHLLFADAPFIPDDLTGGFEAVREKANEAGPVSNILHSSFALSRRRRPCSRKCHDFLQACLHLDPDLRPTAQQALSMLSASSNAAYSSESEID